MECQIEEHVSLKKYTTFKTGGEARYFSSCATTEQIKAAVIFAKKNKVPFFVLGEGSNVLVHDEGYDGLIVHIISKGRTYKTEEDVVYATFAAGELLDDVIQHTVELGYWGLENLSHIPGTVGATPIQNVGAYGVEVSDLIHQVLVYDCEKNEESILTNEQCDFSYRNSIFKNTGKGRYIILAVTFRVTKQYNPVIHYKDIQTFFSTRPSVDTIKIEEVRQAVIKIRAGKFPDWNIVGTAGSFYKNPIIDTDIVRALSAVYPDLPVYTLEDSKSKKVSLGWILDKVCNLRGYKEGEVGTYHKQALVIVSYDSKNTTKDIINFSDKIKNEVYTKTGIRIEEEVTILS